LENGKFLDSKGLPRIGSANDFNKLFLVNGAALETFGKNTE